MKYGKLEVVDVEFGLETMGGMENIYEKVIKQFLSSFDNYEEELKNNISHNLNEAKRLVHSLKGISKNLGSTEFYDASVKYENVIKSNNTDDINYYFSEYISVFKKMYQDLKSITF